MTTIQAGKTYEISRKPLAATTTSLNRKDIPARTYQVTVFEVKSIEGGKTIHYGHRVGGDDTMIGFVLPDSNIESVRVVE